MVPQFVKEVGEHNYADVWVYGDEMNNNEYSGLTNQRT